MGFTLEVDNYRALRKVRWNPSGVCAVTGANGSGKTTLLSVIEFLRHFLQRGIKSATTLAGGTASIRNQQAGPDDDILFRLRFGDGTWTVVPTLMAPDLVAGEVLKVRDSLVAEWGPGMKMIRVNGREFQTSDNSILERTKGILEEPNPEIDALFNFVLGYRLYRDLRIVDLRTTGSLVTSDTELESSGANAFSVLRNWRAGRREHDERFRFVHNGLRECFPELFDDIEFLSAGQTVTVRLFLRGLTEPVHAFAAPHGLLVALLHLCAVASAPDKGAVAIDEPENGLHPFAIRTLLEVIRSRAARKELTVLLSTHSPVLLNEFNTDPSRVYVMEPAHGRVPVPLSEHSDPAWLSHFALGDLYSNQEFGAQQRPPP
ncbi:AAA family ATPase [Pyxidicoccus xibeiensis]|uniref:AAA family ATPase n=1 Tax=Pyxidicoccus xibeiensis TaxID=2906759 RepID=UPI0020A819B5|nr:AAA family ATPase [Pyxidicoccus xibeiensis]MCP3137297.1 ATP-binding protein [Pyxidicoccus xibeiensis]